MLVTFAGLEASAEAVRRILKGLAGRRFEKPWLLAGGLTPDNVAEAARISGAPMVDVSSGVEDRPGQKNTSKIKAFLDAIRQI